MAMERELLRLCSDLILHSSSAPPLPISLPPLFLLSPPPSPWISTLEKLHVAVRSMDPAPSSSILLSFLRLHREEDLPDAVVDVLSHFISLCCCGSPSPSPLTFTFSPVLTVHIKEMDYAKGGLGWKVWGTALILSQRLITLQKHIQNKKVLELGSGCGLCGLLLSKLGASEVVLSDYLPEIVANLCENVLLLPATCHSIDDQASLHTTMQQSIPCLDYIHMQATTMDEQPCNIRVRLLDWSKDASNFSSKFKEEIQEPTDQSPLELKDDEKFDWIIGSELIYKQYNIRSLVGVIHNRLLKPHGNGLFVSAVRENRELDLFTSELNTLGMDVDVEHCTEEEWETCINTLTSQKNEGTLHGIEYYEGGITIISVRHKV